MKKPAQTLLPSRLILALFAMVAVVLTGMVVYRQLSLSDYDTKAANASDEMYGPLGYGRGQGSRSGNGQGRLNAAQITPGLTKDNCLMDGCLMAEGADYPVAKLDDKTIEYLNLALADERKALATYQATMARFGSVKPFINIARAEEQHISMLLALFDKYGVTIPKDTTKVSALPATLAEVCAIGVTAEIDNDALYQRMLPEIMEQDIKTVFTSLARASKEMHLPAFQRCAN